MRPGYLHLFPNYITKTVPTVVLSQQFLNRYPKLPAGYIEFLDTFSLLSNQSDTTWFNSIIDFNAQEERVFGWDEFERQSLEAFEGDVCAQNEVREFWNKHVPIVLSVKGGYSHFSIGVGADNWGKVYFGEEPEYELVALVSSDFSQFIDALGRGELEERYQHLFT